ncbi:MAG: 4-(cytidine 5'-diphospho)-2-C-methyl-D-erythritol kinase, partial [Sphaerochaetaceae bacterium]
MVGLAYAKVNLHLSVGPLRGDAFHSIVSIFQKIDLYDTIEIEVQEASEFSIEIEGINFPNSTIERAARLFSAESKISLKVKAKCTKRIPIQGGLGGGSSDGATTLTLLNAL